MQDQIPCANTAAEKRHNGSDFEEQTYRYKAGQEVQPEEIEAYLDEHYPRGIAEFILDYIGDNEINALNYAVMKRAKGEPVSYHNTGIRVVNSIGERLIELAEQYSIEQELREG